MDITLVLTITGTKNHELQGLLLGEDDQQPVSFQSVLELILLLEKKAKNRCDIS